MTVILIRSLHPTGMGGLVYKLLTFRRWNDEVRHMRGFFVTFAVLLLELGVENFFIFVSRRSSFCSVAKRCSLSLVQFSHVQVFLITLALYWPGI